jgi:hypothetical protein
VTPSFVRPSYCTDSHFLERQRIHNAPTRVAVPDSIPLASSESTNGKEAMSGSHSTPASLFCHKDRSAVPT